MEPSDLSEFLTWIGQRIRILRKERGVSQERLAELAGLHPTSLSDIERGKVNGALGTFRNLAEAMDVSLAELVDTSTDAMEVEDWREMRTLSLRINKLDSKKRAVFIEAALKLLDKVESI